MSFERLDIERLLDRLGIVAKKKAKEWVALCPNPEHDDGSPSWRIRDDPGATRHGFHHCWPCGFGGGVVDLVQRVLDIDSRRDAKEWIEEGLPVEQRAVQAVELKIVAAGVGFRLPEEVRFDPFDQWPSLARAELAKRQIEEWQVERWGIGFASSGRLKGRLVFVLRDAKGRPRGYSARTFVDEGKRYLEPEELERADPTAMFGEQHWPSLKERKEGTPVFVLEGAIKALAVEAALPGCFVAATTGSEHRPLHAAKLASFDRQCLIGDDDKAGDKISDALHASLARHANPERLKLPEGKDADELPRDVLRRTLLDWLRRTRS